MIDEKVLLKDTALNETRIKQIARGIRRVYPAFDGEGFAKKVLGKFPELELKARIGWVAENLKTFLPEDYGKATAILLTSLPPHDDAGPIESDFGLFTYAPYSDFVAKYGLAQKDLTTSLKALKEMTKHYSAEDAIRYFINAFPKETFAELLTWSQDKDYHVRRLTSEGTRPILPWSPKIHTSLEAALPILDNLFCDNNRFVTRSVANHLNDISRKDPDLTLATLKRWRASNKQNAQEMDFIIRQGLRTLIKNGYPAAFEFLGLSAEAEVTLSGLKIKTDPVVIGGALEFEFTLTAQKDERLIIDYVLHFPNKAGTGHNKKVFKLKSVHLVKGQSLTITKRQPLRNLSIRKLTPGKHRLEIQINGQKMAESNFELTRS